MSLHLPSLKLDESQPMAYCSLLVVICLSLYSTQNNGASDHPYFLGHVSKLGLLI